MRNAVVRLRNSGVAYFHRGRRRRRARRLAFSREQAQRYRYHVPKSGSQVTEKSVSRNTNRRCRYDRVFRPELTALTVMENIYVSQYDRQEYRDLRFLYYLVLPRVYERLACEANRQRASAIEGYLYEQMLLHMRRRSTPRQPSRLYLMWNDDDNQTPYLGLLRSSSEPFSESLSSVYPSGPRADLPRQVPQG